MSYQPASNRYQRNMQYRRCGKSGIKLSALSLGLWHNFSDVDVLDNCKAILKTAFAGCLRVVAFVPLLSSPVHETLPGSVRDQTSVRSGRL